MKKFIPYFILTAICATLFFGCVPAPVDSGDDSDRIDLYEMEFIIYQINGISQSGAHPMLCTSGTDRAEMALQRVAEIEEEYNCTITFSYNEHSSGVNDLFAAAAINKTVADIVVSENIDNIYNLVSGDLLYNILDLNDIIGYDSSTFDIYGAPEHLEAYMYEGQLLAVTPIAHPGYQLHRSKFILADTEIVTEYTGMDVRELHEKEEWTWTAFETVLRKCTVKEDGATRIYGGAFNQRELIEASLGSNGYKLVTKNSDGVYSLNESVYAATGALDWCRKLLTEYADNISLLSGWRARAEAFVDGSAALINLSGRYLANEVCYKKDNFALLPFPCGPSGTYGEHRSTGNVYQGLSIYKYADDPESVALILKAYCQPFDEYPDKDALKEYYQYMLWDQRDIDLIFDPDIGYSNYNYNPLIGSDFYDSLSNRLFSMSSAQLMQAYLPMIESTVEEWIAPNYELMEELSKS